MAEWQGKARQRDELRTVHNLGNSSTRSLPPKSPATAKQYISRAAAAPHRAVAHQRGQREFMLDLRRRGSGSGSASGSERVSCRPFVRSFIRRRRKTCNSAVGRPIDDDDH